MLSPETLTQSMVSLQERGYCTLAQAFTDEQHQLLSQVYDHMLQTSLAVLQRVSQSNQSLSEFYKSGQEKVIVVPENDNKSEICRFEYITPESTLINRQLVPYFQQVLFDITGTRYTLFKDKCNVKRPGGGAFGCHQDYPAYADFAPDAHLTVAIFLDQPTIRNGCLEMAANWKQVMDTDGARDHAYPEQTVFRRDPDSGDVLPDIADQFHWQRILPQRNDLVIFDSVVPHRSEINASHGARRAFFFTFAPESSGDHYEHYYHAKRQVYDNPKFHLSTPTDRGL